MPCHGESLLHLLLSNISFDADLRVVFFGKCVVCCAVIVIVISYDCYYIRNYIHRYFIGKRLRGGKCVTNRTMGLQQDLCEVISSHSMYMSHSDSKSLGRVYELMYTHISHTNMYMYMHIYLYFSVL